jgi:hypothetical protein
MKKLGVALAGAVAMVIGGQANATVCSSTIMMPTGDRLTAQWRRHYRLVAYAVRPRPKIHHSNFGQPIEVPAGL